MAELSQGIKITAKDVSLLRDQLKKVEDSPGKKLNKKVKKRREKRLEQI